MIAFLLVWIIVAACLETYMGKIALRSLRCGLSCSKQLLEPGEEFEVLMVVENHSRWPILYLRMNLLLPRECCFRKEDQPRVSEYLNMVRYRYTGYLMPHQRLEIPLALSIPARGSYQLGGFSMAAGDLLGIQDDQEAVSVYERVTVMPKRLPSVSMEDLAGGLLGQLSVRRFLHEDPILSAGYREYSGREPMKQIAWTKSLASGRMMVRQYDHTAEPRAIVVLAVEDGSEEELETCFSMTRMVCEMLEERHIPYAFRTDGDVHSFLGWIDSLESGLGRKHLEQILDGLGRAGYGCRGSLEQILRREKHLSEAEQGYLLIVPHRTEAVLQALKMIEKRGTGVKVLTAAEGGSL